MWCSMPVKGIEITGMTSPLADIAATIEDANTALESNTPVLLRALEGAVNALGSGGPALSRRKMVLVLDLLGNHHSLLEEPLKNTLATLQEAVPERLQFANTRLLNWGMVMLWTNFEVQIEQLLRTLFNEQPKAFLSWQSNSSITAEQLQEFDNLQEAKSSLYERAIQQFSNEAIDWRIYELARRLNVPPEQLFSLSLSSDSLREKLKGWGPYSLKALSDKRNSIVYEQRLVVRQLSEIQDAVLILAKFLLNVAGIVANRLGVPLLLQSIPLLEMREKSAQAVPMRNEAFNAAL